MVTSSVEQWLRPRRSSGYILGGVVVTSSVEQWLPRRRSSGYVLGGAVITSSEEQWLRPRWSNGYVLGGALVTSSVEQWLRPRWSSGYAIRPMAAMYWFATHRGFVMTQRVGDTPLHLLPSHWSPRDSVRATGRRKDPSWWIH